MKRSPPDDPQEQDEPTATLRLNDRKRKKQRLIVERMYYQVSGEELSNSGIGAILLLNLFDKWSEIRKDIRDEITHQVCQILAKTPRAPLKMAEKLISEICLTIQIENIPHHPLNKHQENHIINQDESLPPPVGSDEHIKRSCDYAKKIMALRKKINMNCAQFDAAYNVWIVSQKTNKMVEYATEEQAEERWRTESSIPLESGIRAKKTIDEIPQAGDTECPYAEIQREPGSGTTPGTTKRALLGTPLPFDMRKDGTMDENPKK